MDPSPNSVSSTCGDGEPSSYDTVKCIADWLLERTDIRPKIGIICGSGLGTLADTLEDGENNKKISFKYEDIPNFPTSTVPGHKGRLLFGFVNKVPVMCMQGRFHFYEGYPLKKCAMPVRVMKLCGASHLIVSNAAGGLNRNFNEGDVMIIKDHINIMGFAGNSPLVGHNDERFGERFIALNNAYDMEIRKEAKKLAKESGLSIQEGVYSVLGGPTFESVAEVKFLEKIGADAVGMSTVHEVLLARHSGMKVFGFSLITNVAVMTYEDEDDNIKKPTHGEVLEVAKQNEEKLKNWIIDVITFIHKSLNSSEP